MAQSHPDISLPNAPAPAHNPYAAWQYRDFKLFAAGWIVSLIGQQMQTAAIGYEIFSRTHRPISLGWMGLILSMPVLFLALPAGHLADRFDRRKIVLTAQLIAALASVALAVISFYHWDYRWMYLPPLITNVGFTFSRAARQAMLPSLVPAKDFPNAVTWNSSLFETSSMLGPAIGGMVIARSFAHWQSAWVVYALTVVGQMVYFFFLLGVRSRTIAGEGRNAPATLQGLIAGVRFVWRTKIILATMTLDLFGVLLGGATYLLPVFQEILKVGPVGYGWLRAAPAAGAFTMAMTLAHLPPMKRAGRAMLLAFIGFGLVTIVFGISGNFWLSMAMLFLAGVFDNVSVVVRHTLIQLKTPDGMRGRVSAVNGVFIGASNELGGFESGLTAQWWGAVGSVVIGGLGTLGVVAAVAAIWPQIRRFGALNEAKVDVESNPLPVISGL